MPTIHREAGLRFYFYSHEPDEPPHVHIDGQGASAKVWLQPVTLARNTGFRARDLTRALQIVRANSDAFVEAWHGFFGTSN